jgi:hypothetical protein
MRDDDDIRIGYSILPFDPLDFWSTRPVDPAIQRQALDNTARQIIDCLSEALKQKDDPWRAMRVIVKGESIVAGYVNHRFDQLTPFQRQLQATLHKQWRVARRRFIRAALRAPEHEYQKYLETFKEGWLDGPDADEDFRAAERHVDEGARLFEGLWPKAERQ